MFGFENWFWGHGAFGLLLTVLSLTLLVSLAVLTVRALSATSRIDKDRSDSMQILKAKYAAGEISEEEYRRMREILLS